MVFTDRPWFNIRGRLLVYDVDSRVVLQCSGISIRSRTVRDVLGVLEIVLIPGVGWGH